ncbi:MAG: hypothetical protein LBC65_04650, partial [Oscillospiraceae bacterium]|nr:hypothetical protein [Oscillospiraceae bacterium]
MTNRLSATVGRIVKPKGIKRRWLARSITVTFAIVIVGVLAYAFAISRYYYSGMQVSLVMKARTATDFFANYSTRTYTEYYQSAYLYTERFDDRDKLELQFIGPGGRIEASTYGITAGSSPDSP